MKVYEKQGLSDELKRKNVEREISVLEHLDHPGIAKLYEVLETPTQVLLVMELIEGSSLYQFVKTYPQRRLEEKHARALFRQIASAVAYCHRQSVAHRDIKLENVLMDKEGGNVKLIDFGFSTFTAPGRATRFFCGTPAYMAPEIVAKKDFEG